MADIVESDVEDRGSPAPRTPERDARPELHPYSHHRDDGDDTSTTHLSPPASPSMSLYSLGMSPLSPLRRQFSPPILRSSPSYPQSQSDEDHEDHEGITQDSKDVLVQRLNDIAKRLSRQHHVKDQNINILHAKVDELENALRTPGYQSKTEKTQHPGSSPLGPTNGDRYGSDLSWEALHPPDLLPSDVSSLSLPRHTSPSAKTGTGHKRDTKAKSHAPKMTVAQAEQVVAEAQSLYKDLETVISNLRDRQEETEHIHALLITRLERAAQRIIYLEEQLEDFESERKEGETEMLNLQIQLKAIEVQCLNYVPKDADQELRESIDTWKMEWSTLKRKRARNKEQLHGTPGTPTRRRAAPNPE
ncbi:hypothetical protein HD806DRAFT_527000 [Xylariaceae sp. AK1471]|nr:hypothetical protein HD806DRAFT_527000 [Xylariaceae sp. AK1471]